ncbi:DUF1549 domain-containing protein [uncultured Rubinisphaera sp.]|uniref:DUF1549 domain-containing protein n=1 Tax=uncultured Rubinisphaera sp. TaxID=1678686 RepID=UPI0030DDA8E0
MTQSLRLIFGFILGSQLLSSSLLQAEQSEVEFFEKKIRPVLVKHCYECHSVEASAVKGGLLLDSREGLLAGGDSGPSLVPGKSAESTLIESLKYESYEMPPSGKLPEHVIRDFEQWIDTGAIDPRAPTQKQTQAGIDWEAARQFWAYQPLPESTPAGLSTTKLIDHSLQQELDKVGATSNPIASPEQRIRRLYYDLTGLPPSPRQIMDFVNDPSAVRWENTVEELLASKQFGEHWGRHWLDVVRYADSNGNDFNATYHNAWRYRNYVIEAFNNNKPFDQFLREQIAGDLMPAKDPQEQYNHLVATGFLMVGPKMLSERDKEKLEFDIVDEQIDSIGKAFLGLSLGCARCHDHKFDPIPTADYYALAGIFRSTQVLDGESQKYVSDWVRRELPTTKEHREQLAFHNAETKTLTAAIKAEEKAVSKAEQILKEFQEGQDAYTIDNTKAKLTGNWTSSTYSKDFIGSDYIHDNKEKSPVKQALFSMTIGKTGKYHVRFGYKGNSGRDEKVPVTIKHGEQEQTFYIDQTKPAPIRGQFIELGEFEYAAGDVVEVLISNEGTTGYVIVDAVQFLLHRESSEESLDADRLAELEKAVKAAKSALKSSQDKLAELKKNAPKPMPLAFAVKDREDCSDCEIMIRGDHLNKGEVVSRGTLQIISGEQASLKNPTGSGRLEFANWITSDAAPLASRVYVNRLWLYLFGEGIVRSVDNFGALGIPPSHPELLDALALRFQESNWSTKDMVRAIVLTEAYQRSTENNKESYKLDPENRLLWRSHRRPLTAEEIQDTFLVYRDSLDPSQAESTVSQFGTLVSNNSSNSQSKTEQGVTALKRTIYQPVLRSQLSELAYLFDFANPEMVVGKRPPTNVPAQALFLMNNDLPRETASALVSQMFEEHGTGSFTILNDLYLKIFGRLPDKADDQLAKNYLQTRLEDNADPEEVKAAWIDYVQAMLASTEFRYLD